MISFARDNVSFPQAPISQIVLHHSVDDTSMLPTHLHLTQKSPLYASMASLPAWWCPPTLVHLWSLCSVGQNVGKLTSQELPSKAGDRVDKYCICSPWSGLLVSHIVSQKVCGSTRPVIHSAHLLRLHILLDSPPHLAVSLSPTSSWNHLPNKFFTPRLCSRYLH